VTESGGGSPEIRVLAGNPTATELAAVTAVVSALVAENDGQQMATVPAVRSAWSFTQRQLRREMFPGPGAWNRRES
jgi:hypothetical protein